MQTHCTAQRESYSSGCVSAETAARLPPGKVFLGIAEGIGFLVRKTLRDALCST